MKAKTIPFDLETAKKIQAGEIEGRIMYFGLHGYKEIIILSYNSDKYGEDYPIRFAFVNTDEIDYLSSTESLFIELPEEMLKHKYIYEFDENPKKLLRTEKIEQVAAKITVDGFVIKNRYEEHDYGKSKHEFKPFDKVLVRNCEHWEWEPAIFSKKDDIMYVTTGGIYWNYCIPYEGNEHLVGTTNKPE